MLKLLTPRQRQIAKLICAGISNREIGELLGVKEGTVKRQLNLMFTRLGLSSRFAVAARLFEEHNR